MLSKRWKLEVGPQRPHMFISKQRASGLGLQCQCTRCGRGAFTWGGHQQLARSERPGSPAECSAVFPVMAAGFRPQGHSLFAAGCVVFCELCGKYASSNVVGLKARCNGLPASAKGRDTTQLQRLKAGKHPRTKERLGPVTRISAQQWAMRCEHRK